MKEESVVHIFQWKDRETVPGQRQQIDTTKNLLAEGRNITELKTITEYFRRLYYIKGDSLDKKHILELFKDRDYHFATAAREFKLIEENTVTVYINREPEADALLQEIRQKGMTRSLMRKAGQYCVNVYRGEGTQERLFEKMYRAGMLREVVDDAQDFYELIDEKQYQEDTGLKLNVEFGNMMEL